MLAQIEVAIDQPPQPHGFMAWLEQPHIKWAVPIPVLLLLAPLVWAFFRKTWKELDEEAFQQRRALMERVQSIPPEPQSVWRTVATILFFVSAVGFGFAGFIAFNTRTGASRAISTTLFFGLALYLVVFRLGPVLTRLERRSSVDYRPLVALVLGGFILIVQDYYGGRPIYDQIVRVWLQQRETLHPHGAISLEKYDDLYALAWWAITRMGGYVLPLFLWRFFFPRDNVLDFGLRTRGFLEHAWIYAMFVTVMIPLMMIVARQPDFGTYYPFYRNCTRSWQDFGMWEVLYIGQFLTLEIFFRGWWVRATRSFGAGAIFCMVVPYAMIHIGKPYLEACGAIVAGTVLGSLSMKTRSIYAGFLVHITVAILMDLLALRNRHALPTLWRPEGTKTFVFTHLDWLLWGVWIFAIVLFVAKIVRSRAEIAEGVRRVFGKAPVGSS